MGTVQQPGAEAEHSVVARMALGERQALAELYSRFERPLLSYLQLVTSDPGLAEELLQDTLLAAWTGARGYAGHSSVQGWLFGIARRRAHDAMRRRSLRLVDSSELEETPSADPNPEDVMLATAERDEVTAAIARLAPMHREVLVLTFVHELSYQDLAEVLAIPIGTVKSRLSHAKRALRTLLRAKVTSP
jgi:RNA polymerase sigma factor (sigma-70 family)